MKIRFSVLVSVVAAGFAVSGPGVAAQEIDARTCTCSDYNNIMNRLNRVDAISALMLQIWQNTAATVEFTNDAKEQMNNDINQSAAKVPDPYPVNYTGTPNAYTTPDGCEIKLPENVSPCITSSLNKHELVHQKACLAVRNSGLGLGLRWHTMRDYIAEDLSAYAAETSFLTHQANKLSCSCPYYAVRVQTSTQVQISNALLSISSQSQAKGDTGDAIEVPLTFAGARLSGEASGTMGEGGMVIPNIHPQDSVRTSGRAALTVDVAGELTPGLGFESPSPAPGTAPAVHLDLRGTPGDGTITLTGTPVPRGYVSANVHGDPRDFEFDLPGYVGSEQAETDPIRIPGVERDLKIQIVEQKEKAAMTAAESWPPGTTAAKHFLPVCDAVKPP